MKPIVTPSHMATLDRYAIDELGIPGLVLMENAGRGIAESAMAMAQRDKPVHIYCGAGNNGGDGYVVARHLLHNGFQVQVFILTDREKIKGDSLTNLQILEKMGQTVHYIKAAPQIPVQPGLIIDALLGTGATGPLKGFYAEIVEHINRSGVNVLSVDMPTGINAETGAVFEPVVKAQKTCTMALLKTGLLLAPAREFAGQIRVVDISLPQQTLLAKPPRQWLLESSDIRSRLPVRPRDAYKNQVGTVAILAGSTGFCGAAALTALSTLRSGVGLCFLAFPAGLNTVMAAKLTEPVLWPMPDQGHGFLTLECADELYEKIRSQNAWAVGPGLGQASQTKELLFNLLQRLALPLVLDADGLNLCSQDVGSIKSYHGDMVLTPHAGELARLLKAGSKEIVADRVAMVQRAAREFEQVVVLKGSPTLVADRQGTVFFNSTGNAGMATAGSGDVLTGVIAALLAQGLNSLDAALVGVYLHGLAGDMAKKQFGEISLMAGDILAGLAQAFVALEEGDA